MKEINKSITTEFTQIYNKAFNVSQDARVNGWDNYKFGSFFSLFEKACKIYDQDRDSKKSLGISMSKLASSALKISDLATHLDIDVNISVDNIISRRDEPRMNSDNHIYNFAKELTKKLDRERSSNSDQYQFLDFYILKNSRGKIFYANGIKPIRLNVDDRFFMKASFVKALISDPSDQRDSSIEAIKTLEELLARKEDYSQYIEESPDEEEFPALTNKSLADISESRIKLNKILDNPRNFKGIWISQIIEQLCPNRGSSTPLR